MPDGLTESDVVHWYAEHMPEGGNFRGLRWLEALPPSGDFGEDWYWCSGPAESLDVSFGQNDPSDGGRAFVSIAIQDVSDGACG